MIMRCIYFFMSYFAFPQLAIAAPADKISAQKVEVEYRALTALESQESKQDIFLSWRMLESDGANTSYDVFSTVNGKEPSKLNQQPIVNRTNFVDRKTCAAQKGCDAVEWFVKINRARQGLSIFSETTRLPVGPDKDKIVIDNGKESFGRRFAFGDLTGDGRFEYVLRFSGTDIDPYYKMWRPSTSSFKLLAFDAQGAVLWEYDMGNSIEQGSWYSPYLLYDLDQDGKAELIVKAGDDNAPDSSIKDSTGRVVKGNEYLRIVSGEDGKTALAQTAWPDREGFVGETSQPYSLYNYSSRHQLAIAYLDGQHPHVIVERGTYNKQKVYAYRFDRKRGLEQVWAFENQHPKSCTDCSPEMLKQFRELWGQGAHTIRVADLDRDGRDEVVIGSYALDHDGKVLWSINKGDLDHIHLGDLDPTEPGLEIYYGAERSASSGGMGMIRAATGEYLWAVKERTSHIHKEGLCADLLREFAGAECLSGEANHSQHWVWDSGGKVLSHENLGLSPKAVYWADMPQKLLVRQKLDIKSGVYAELLDFGSRKPLEILKLPSTMPVGDREYFTVLAYADLLGDWREEIIGVARGKLVIYVSRLPSDHRIPWLMQDAVYSRNSILGSMGYYHQPLLGYDLCSVFTDCAPSPES
jgi:rhamnogalacturonan endolyase